MERYGPQPPEGVLSVVCQEFGCLPSQAQAEDWHDVEKVMDYRRAILARDLINDGGRGFEQLQKRPDLLQLLLDISRAQTGSDMSMHDLMTALAEKAASADTDRTEE